MNKDLNVASKLKSLSAIFRRTAGEAESRARELEKQARITHAEASELRRKARTLEEAFLLVEKEQQSSIDSLQLDDLVKKMKKNIRVVFLIDGSTSMGPDSTSFNNSLPPQLQPLKAAVNAAADISQKIVAHGGTAETLIFGDWQPILVDLTNAATRQKALHLPRSGSNLAPAVIELAKSVKKTQPTHIVLLSDGDMFDTAVSQPALQQLMTDNPKVTLNAIVISDTRQSEYSAMSRMINTLAKGGRESRIELAHCDLRIDPNLVMSTAGKMIANLIEEQASKKAFTKRKRVQPKA